MTSNEIIRYIRRDIRQLVPSETYQDSYLWNKFTIARSYIYKNKLNRNQRISDLAYHQICIELKDAKPYDCPCVRDGCQAKISKNYLPSYLQYSANSTLTVLVNNNVIPISKQDQIDDDLLYSPGYKDKPVAVITKGKLIIYNANLNYVEIRAIFTNPLELLFIQECTEETCLQDNKNFIQISEEVLYEIMQVLKADIVPTYVDNTNDNNEQV